MTKISCVYESTSRFVSENIHGNSVKSSQPTSSQADNGLQDGLIGTYGWRTLESQQWSDYAEAVTGFLKIGPKITESVLKLSGNHGVFFEPLAKIAQTL